MPRPATRMAEGAVSIGPPWARLIHKAAIRPRGWVTADDSELDCIEVFPDPTSVASLITRSTARLDPYIHDGTARQGRQPDHDVVGETEPEAAISGLNPAFR